MRNSWINNKVLDAYYMEGTRHNILQMRDNKYVILCKKLLSNKHVLSTT